MSHTIKPHSCAAIRQMAYSYRRDELAEVDRALFEETIIACPACGRFASRLMEMLDEAPRLEAEQALGRALDAPYAESLFEGILAGIASSSSQPDEHLTAYVPNRPSELDESSDAFERLTMHLKEVYDEEEEQDEAFESALRRRARRRRVIGLFAAAAALLACLGAAALSWEQSVPTTRPLQQQEVAERELTPQARRLAESEAFEALIEQHTSHEAIKVFANPEASWRIDGESPDYTLKLDRGTVLVEFLPTERESLRVLSGETSVEVVGTVFYVTAPPSLQGAKTPPAGAARVGVLTGKVHVDRDVEEQHEAIIELVDGEQLDEEAARSPIDETISKRARALIDLDAHRAMLVQRRERATEEQTPLAAPERSIEGEDASLSAKREPLKASAKTGREKTARSVIRARREALDSAMRERDYERAAGELEALLELAPGSSVEHATYRLELARISMRYIGDRAGAMKHLKLFIAEHPQDVAAPSARRQLCRLLGARAVEERECLELEAP